MGYMGKRPKAFKIEPLKEATSVAVVTELMKFAYDLYKFKISLKMIINIKHFNDILSDNELHYFNLLSGVIESVDELSILQITKLRDSYLFRLSPSTPQYNNSIIEELLKFHNMFGIHLDMSKSIKTSSVINFRINM